jgi:hypothetical protein
VGGTESGREIVRSNRPVHQFSSCWCCRFFFYFSECRTLGTRRTNLRVFCTTLEERNSSQLQPKLGCSHSNSPSTKRRWFLHDSSSPKDRPVGRNRPVLSHLVGRLPFSSGFIGTSSNYSPPPLLLEPGALKQQSLHLVSCPH